MMISCSFTLTHQVISSSRHVNDVQMDGFPQVMLSLGDLATAAIYLGPVDTSTDVAHPDLYCVRSLYITTRNKQIDIKSKPCFEIVSQIYFDIPLQALQSLLGIYFPIASFLWTDAIAIHIYMFVSDLYHTPT